jgi:hypothetical protein
MATRAYQGAAPAAPILLPPILAFIMGTPAAPRAAVEAVIERAIAALDEIDGDPDLEGAHDEDVPDFRKRPRDRSRGAGCIISDPDDDRTAPAETRWEAVAIRAAMPRREPQRR